MQCGLDSGNECTHDLTKHCISCTYSTGRAKLHEAFTDSAICAIWHHHQCHQCHTCVNEIKKYILGGRSAQV